MKNRILIVEDDPGISDALGLHLQFIGYDYKIINDGKEAEEYIRDDHNFDLALLDIMLPGMDGFELFTHIKEFNIPIIYLTAKSDSVSHVKGLREGAEDYVIKPFDMLALMARIEKVLERTGRLNTTYRIGDVEVDSAHRTVLKRDVEVELQPLEFDVFLKLIKRKNFTVTREELLRDVWGFDFAGETRAIDVKIASLRKKLDLKEEIKTLPKLGYRLEDR